MNQDKYRKSLLLDVTLLLAFSAVFIMAVVTGIITTTRLDTNNISKGDKYNKEISADKNDSAHSVIKKTEEKESELKAASF